MISEAASYRRKLEAHLNDPLNHPRPRVPKALREKMASMGAKGGKAGKGAAKRRSAEHYQKMARAAIVAKRNRRQQCDS